MLKLLTWMFFATLGVSTALFSQSAAGGAAQSGIESRSTMPATAASKYSLDLDNEANKVLSSAQHQIANLPSAFKDSILSTAKPELWTNSNNILQIDPTKLSLKEKNQVIGWLEQRELEQQVPVPSLNPTSTDSTNPSDITDVFGETSPLSAEEKLRIAQNANRLPAISHSVGRFLWADKGSNTWHFEGTVFVIKKNLVATSCHVIEPAADIENGTVVLDRSKDAVIDFSDMELPKDGHIPSTITTYPVVAITGTGATAGCDVAVLTIAGADAVPPLSVADGTSSPKRVLVIGYPYMRDLTATTCSVATVAFDFATQYFCRFHSANPGVAKVKSPGSTYAYNSHEGIDVIVYNSSTRRGQSGSPVLDLDTLNVVGIHYCCTGSSDETGKLGCATWHTQDLKWNEAISTKTILSDDRLREFFSTSPVATTSSSGGPILSRSLEKP